MEPLKFNPDYKTWKEKFDNEPIYTRRQLVAELEKLRKSLKINRVVQSFNGKYGPDCCSVMQILAVHETPEGILIIVR